MGEARKAVTGREASEQVPAPPAANVRRTMFWLTLGTLVYLGGQWLLTVIVVRINGHATNGEFTLGLWSSSVAYAVALFGMRTYQISDTRSEHPDATYLASRVVTSLLAVLAFAVALPFTADAARLWPILALFMGFRLTEGGWTSCTGSSRTPTACGWPGSPSSSVPCWSASGSPRHLP
jgi:hypothetical protein